MRDNRAWTVADHLAIFREDSGFRTSVSLNVSAERHPTAEFVEAAVVAMDDASWSVRTSGAKFFGIASIARQRESVPAALWSRGETRLRALLQDSNVTVAVEAAMALGHVAPTTTNARVVFPFLWSVVEELHAERYYMWAVANATALFAGTAPEEAIRIAPTLLQHSDSEIVCLGLDAIEQCGSLATPFLPRIAELAKDADEDIAESAEQALRKLGHASPTTG